MVLSGLVMLAAALPAQSISRGATISLGQGMSVMRAGRSLGDSGTVTLMDGDMVSLDRSAKEKSCFIAPDNSVISMWPGASFRVEDIAGANREEYVLTSGRYHAYSCPHGAPPGAREIALRTCCIRVWWPEQKGDVNCMIQVVGHEKCTVDTKSGLVFRQKTKGAMGYGPIARLGG